MPTWFEKMGKVVVDTLNGFLGPLMRIPAKAWKGKGLNTGTLSLLKWTEIYLRTHQIPTCHINFNLQLPKRFPRNLRKLKQKIQNKWNSGFEQPKIGYGSSWNPRSVHCRLIAKAKESCQKIFYPHKSQPIFSSLNFPNCYKIYQHNPYFLHLIFLPREWNVEFDLSTRRNWML